MTWKSVGETNLDRALETELRMRLGIAQAANQAGQMLVRKTQVGMRASAVPSNPGGYSGIRTGKLVNSIDYEVEGDRFLRFGSRGAIERGFDYAIAQHEGTNRMAARPYLSNAVETSKVAVQALIGRTVFQKLVGGI
ncbi:MAG: hypothetical protein CTY31_12320 [Hyphomicrobium sp.]|nr:MAG: hypothetical protein CTY39_06250 [Hyphomicrobium sp.]PPC98797.1 MAG: hypothetical protein CTY31_12320 [Hyphomicrobium sp.]